MNFLPLLSRVRRKLGGGTLAEGAAERVELAPASRFDHPPAIALPGEWERVEAVGVAGMEAWERENVAGGPRDHPATTAYRVRDALFTGHEVYAGGRGERVAAGGPRVVFRGRPERIARAQLCTNVIASRYFAHWLLDGFSLELLAHARGLPALTIAKDGWTHAQPYRALADLHALCPPAARVDDLWLVDDIHMNAGRRARLTALRGRIRRPDVDGPRRVFLDRGVTGARRDLANRDAVVAMLRAAGFVELHPERESPARIAAALSDAELCVGVEGSALAHAIALLPPGAALVTLMPPRRFTALMKTYADAAGLRFGYVVGEPAGEDFTIDPARLASTLDLVGGG